MRPTRFFLPRTLTTCTLSTLTLNSSSTAACGDGPSDPRPSAGVFPLRQINDSTLPYDHEGLGCCTYLRGELRLDEGNYTIALTARNRNTGQIFTAQEWGRYVAAGSSLTFTSDSFVVIGFALDVAAVSGDSIRVAFGGEGPGSPDQFNGLFVRAPQ